MKEKKEIYDNEIIEVLKRSRQLRLKSVFMLVIIGFCLIYGFENSENIMKERETVKLEKDKIENQDEYVVQSYKIISEIETPSFIINKNATIFLKEHSDYFYGKEKNLFEIISNSENNIDYSQLSKNVSKYSDRLIEISGYVIDVRELVEGNITYVHIMDINRKNYVLYYLGTLDNVVEGVYACAYSLPLDIITFKNLQNTYTEAVVCASCYIPVITVE